MDNLAASRRRSGWRRSAIENPPLPLVDLLEDVVAKVRAVAHQPPDVGGVHQVISTEAAHLDVSARAGGAGEPGTVAEAGPPARVSVSAAAEAGALTGRAGLRGCQERCRSYGLYACEHLVPTHRLWSD